MRRGKVGLSIDTERAEQQRSLNLPSGMTSTESNISSVLGTSPPSAVKTNMNDLDWQERIDLVRKSTTTVKHLAKPRAQRRASVGGKWTPDEDNSLRGIVETYGAKNWKQIAKLLGPTRTDVQCLHRWNKVLKPGLHKGSWSPDEDEIVRKMVAENIGDVKWSAIAAKLPGRIGKQCRERWFNHLDPDIRRGEWTGDEDRVLYEAQRHFGNRWCEISKILPGRTENAVKNRWNSSTMRKWLKEHDLSPGNGQPMENMSSHEGLERAVNSFNKSLQDAGVTGIDASGLLVVNLDENDEAFSQDKRKRKPIDNKKDNKAKKGRKSNSRAIDTSYQYDPYGYGEGYTQSVMNVPAHLRPPGISIGQDDTTNKIINLLGQIKSTPSPLAEGARVTRGRTRGRLIDHSLHGRTRAPYRSRTNTGTHAEQEGSPTSRALEKVRSIVASQDMELLNGTDTDLEIAPMYLLPYFRFLNETAQKSLMRQLVDKFSRTNTTPRNAIFLPTPKNDFLMSNPLEDVGADVEVPVDSERKDSIGSSVELKSPSASMQSNDLDMLISPKSMAALQSIDNFEEYSRTSSMQQPTNLYPEGDISQTFQENAGHFGYYEDSCVDAAVSLAKEVIFKLSSSEAVMKMLMDGSSNYAGGNSSSSMSTGTHLAQIQKSAHGNGSISTISGPPMQSLGPPLGNGLTAGVSLEKGLTDDIDFTMLVKENSTASSVHFAAKDEKIMPDTTFED